MPLFIYFSFLSIDRILGFFFYSIDKLFIVYAKKKI